MRAGAAAMLGNDAAEAAARHGMQLLSVLEKSTVVGGYWPIGDELDPRFLLHALERAGYAIALPVVAAKEGPLTFRRWGLGDALEEGPYGTYHPEEDAPTVVPDALIVPMLAFDADCYRIGYGGGFYDRTLAAYPHIKAFGFAYGAQFMENIAREEHDWPMQAIISETGVVLPRA